MVLKWHKMVVSTEISNVIRLKNFHYNSYTVLIVIYFSLNFTLKKKEKKKI